MAFFTLFSLFPLLLLLVAAGGSILQNILTEEQILEAALGFIPVSRELIQGNVVAILASRRTVGVVSAIGLLWASTSVFTTLTHNLVRAWPDTPSRGIVKTRLAAVLQVASVIFFITLFLIAQTSLRIPEGWRISVVGGELRLPSFASTPSQAIFSITFVISLALLYGWVPKAWVRWREALAGAVVAALAIHGATSLFLWYLESGLAKYNLVYGSLGALLALMTWAYIISLLILSGAHLSASLAFTSARRARQRGTEGEDAAVPGTEECAEVAGSPQDNSAAAPHEKERIT